MDQKSRDQQRRPTRTLIRASCSVRPKAGPKPETQRLLEQADALKTATPPLEPRFNGVLFRGRAGELVAKGVQMLAILYIDLHLPQNARQLSLTRTRYNGHF